MVLAERISNLQAHVKSRRSAVSTEDAIKTALILPFIRSLGYDVFDPFEVVPGFAQSGAPKVDFAVRDGEDVRMLIMLSSAPADLSTERANRLIECFSKVQPPVAILTDGSTYRVHGSTDDAGVLSPQPLVVLNYANAMDIDPTSVEHLCADTFNLSALAAGAKERHFREAVIQAAGEEFADPTETFVNLIAARLEPTITVPDDFSTILPTIIAGMLSAGNESASSGVGSVGAILAGDERMITDEENTGLHIVRALAARYISPERVVARPAKSYCAILLDDNNRRSIVRLHFNSLSAKYLGTFVDKEETRQPLTTVSAIYALEDFIISRLRELDPSSFDLQE